MRRYILVRIASVFPKARLLGSVSGILRGPCHRPEIAAGRQSDDLSHSSPGAIRFEAAPTPRAGSLAIHRHLGNAD